MVYQTSLASDWERIEAGLHDESKSLRGYGYRREERKA